MISDSCVCTLKTLFLLCLLASILSRIKCTKNLLFFFLRYSEMLHTPIVYFFFSFTCLLDLPASPVDLVINCLDCHENPLLREQSWYQAAADWANQNRAPVLSIDPPVSEQHQTVEAKWILSLGLPLPFAERESKVYLCDIGIPKMVFQEVGIRYHSPFGCKFVIPLHPV